VREWPSSGLWSKSINVKSTLRARYDMTKRRPWFALCAADVGGDDDKTCAGISRDRTGKLGEALFARGATEESELRRGPRISSPAMWSLCCDSCQLVRATTSRGGALSETRSIFT